MNDFNNVAVTPAFVLKHQAVKTVLGMAAGYLVSVAYNKVVVNPALEKIQDEQK